jgi:hypothetical protein
MTKRRQVLLFIVQWLRQFTVILFGFCNIPVMFELLMETVLQGLTYEPYLVYLDHAFLGHTFQEQLEHLLTVFQRFSRAHLTLNSEKCVSSSRRNCSYNGNSAKQCDN